MARGRMINKKISMNKAVNSLGTESALVFTWTIAHLDRDGRIHGNPDVLRGNVVPRRKEITVTKIAKFIAEWAKAGLIEIYETKDGDCFLQFAKFRENQAKLRYDREAESEFPDPDKCKLVSGLKPDKVRTKAGATPSEEKRREVKLKEEKKREVAPAVFMTEKELLKLMGLYGEEITAKCIDKLSHYKKSSGKKYDSDYDAILSWVLERVSGTDKETLQQKQYEKYCEDLWQECKRTGKPYKQPTFKEWLNARKRQRSP